jgi:hypothetical protein
MTDPRINAPGSPLAGQEALTDDDARAILSRLRDNCIGAKGKAMRRQRRALERALELFGALKTATAALEEFVEEGAFVNRNASQDPFDRGARAARRLSADMARAALRAIRKA